VCSIRALNLGAPGGRALPTHPVSVGPSLQAFDLFSQIFLRFTEFLLESPKQLVVFSFGKREVIVGQLRIFLFQFAFHFVPTALEFQFRHSDRDIARRAIISCLTQHKAMREEVIESIYHDWDKALSRSDVEALLNLYAHDAVLESPLVSHLCGKERGICSGHEELRPFFEMLRERKPPVRQHYRKTYFTDGKTVIWEHPRETPKGEQMDFAEAMEINGEGLIQHHNVYWGC
jgi:hypothetical protein